MSTMTKRQQVSLMHPEIWIDKVEKPILFIDTYMWHSLKKEHNEEARLLQQCCNTGVVSVAITNLIAAELTQRKLKQYVEQICGEALIEVPVGRITANQVIRALLCYRYNRKRVTLHWESVISEVPILNSLERGLKEATEELACNLNRFRTDPSVAKEDVVAHLVDVERQIWHKNLKLYDDLLRGKNTNQEDDIAYKITYDSFFLTDYFTDLPAVLLRSYLFAYVLNERALKPNDVIDIYTLSELAPYTTLYVMDNDQHARFKKLQRHYPALFDQSKSDLIPRRGSSED